MDFSEQQRSKSQVAVTLTTISPTLVCHWIIIFWSSSMWKRSMYGFFFSLIKRNNSHIWL